MPRVTYSPAAGRSPADNRSMMMSIINLTQHPATAEQRQAGVFDLPADERAIVKEALTFDAPPTPGELRDRADRIAAIAADVASPEDRDHGGGFALAAMIAGAPYLMAPLERALLDQGIQPIYSFSARESEEQTQPDGSVRKVNVFRHLGFVEAA